MCRRLRGQARFHRGLGATAGAGLAVRLPSRASLQSLLVHAKAAYTPNPCGSGLARESGVSVMNILDVPPPSRASPLPQGIGDYRTNRVDCQAAFAGEPAKLVGACKGCVHPKSLWERACPRKRCVCYEYVGCAAAFAGKPAPTGDWGLPQEPGWLSGSHRENCVGLEPGPDVGMINAPRPFPPGSVSG